jgi:D-xylose 1-dehydrogenase (NADP+, D-xylono-1,5-lactone-forming)
MESIRWGILGVANIALRAVIPAIQRSRNGRVVAIASRSRARAEDAARQFDISRAHASYEALLDDPDVQAVYIPLPNSLHHPWTLRCAEAHKHVLCEKPLALSPEDCQEMIAACRRQRVTLMEAFMYRFHPRTERVAHLVAEGALGEVRFVRASFTIHVRDSRDNIRLRPDLGGGALYDVGCYAINVSRMILGEPQSAHAFGYVSEYGVDDLVSGVLKFGARQFAALDCSLSLAPRKEYEIVGTDGRLEVPNAFVPGTTDAEIHLIRGTERSVVTIPGADQYQRMVEHFADVVLTGATLRLPPEDAVGNLRVITALLTSLRKGTVEKIEA